ncbi:type III restriction-modification system restriction subunit R [Thermosynechococcus sp. NK55a]|nr:type III restriction-modification system restriction subunit R [Thermosynechococcus sp. NK55a]
MARRRASPGRQVSQSPALKFEQRLVLHQWMLDLFGVSSFERLAANLKAPELEGFDENNVTRFHHVLRLGDMETRGQGDRSPSPRRQVSPSELLAYDQNIVRHWRRITERRNHAGPFLYPKYFQYLALLFTEIYLDRYFRDPEGLLTELNAHVGAFNARLGDMETRGQGDLSPSPRRQVSPSQIEPYTRQDLNKVAFWMATGSGKTLLMHINILQYQHYLNLHGGKPVNRVILLTPNEGLSHQHLAEFQLSGIEADLFSKEGWGLFTGRAVEILDIHKLRDEMGEKTVAVEAFEGNNLVLVDEGHRGTSGTKEGAWMQKRNLLCENGFSFEYSATFGQAMNASENRELEQVYAKCILFDYSYKYFYGDGYGKDYRILNLADDSDETIRRRYLTACLLSFYQQLKLYREKAQEFRPLIERPLWVFVGGSVNAVRSENKRKVSDVVDILLFLASFVRERNTSVGTIERLLKGNSGLLDQQNRDIFAGAFQYLNTLGLTPDQVFDDILHVLFHASTTAALHVENLKGTDGEVALRLGDNEPFGVINVGDVSALCKLCEEQQELVVTEKAFSGSLFRTLNDEASTINILIGSKKFTEGWSSWRVSTMGLMNIGRNEGPQIIQLFGRGVRLKGKDFSLKRSRRLERQAVPKHIETLETLNIFGIRADYMRQFKEYLEDEGLPANEDRIEFVLPVIKNLGSKKLKIVRLKEGVNFKTNGQKPVLDGEPPEFLKRYPVILDWYPKLQAMASGAGRTSTQLAERDRCYFEQSHLAFFDFDAIYFELQQFKNERAWHNLTLPRKSLPALLGRKDWYVLFIPKEEMQFWSFQQVQRWQEIAAALVKKYLDRYYKFKKQEFEGDHLEYQQLSADDPNFVSEYRLLIEQSREDIVQKLEAIKSLMESGRLKEAEFSKLAFEQDSFRAIVFAGHLYQPLIYVGNNLIEVKPVVLENQGERDFVLDLQKFCESSDGENFLKGKELYLLRNLSRGRGIGFFEAGNFYPDFILWLLVDGKQYVSFIDPKGLRNLEGPEDPKIRFHLTIKELERQLDDPTVVLNSFIVASTPFNQVKWWNGGMTKEELEKRNVLFQQEDRDTYVKILLNKILLNTCLQ